jgi:hypothetical protein
MMVVGLSSGERHEVNFNEGQFAFGWEIKEEEGKIEIDCLGETLGYVGIGFNPKNGKMNKAEMAIGGVTDEDGQPYHGIYIGRHHKVKVHKKGQKQWELLEARQNDTHTFVKYSRPLSSKRRLSELEMMKNNLIPEIDCSIENDQQHQHTQDNLHYQQYQTNHTIESRSSSSSDIIPIKVILTNSATICQLLRY